MLCGSWHAATADEKGANMNTNKALVQAGLPRRRAVLVGTLPPAQRPHCARPRWTVQPDPHAARHAEIREPADRRRGRLRDRTRPLLRPWPTRCLGRCRHRPHRGRPAGRALGRAPGRGDRGAIAQRLADVRGPVPRLTFSTVSPTAPCGSPVLASGTSRKRLNQGAIRHDAGRHEANPRR